MSEITTLAAKLKVAALNAKDNFNPDLQVDTRDILALVEALEAAEKRNAELVHNHRVHAARLIDERGQLKQRIAELEAKLQAADKLQDSAFRHGLQHGFSLGQTDNQAGFEQCVSAYSPEGKKNG